MIKIKVKNKDSIEVFCKFCERAIPLSAEGKLVCEKHGVVSEDHHCRKFVYDPLKRAPKLPQVRNDELEFPDLVSIEPGI